MPRAITLTRLGLFGSRAPLLRTPADAGLRYEEVDFPATDGVDLRGWFVPADGSRAPTVIWVHGWLWNRLGNVAGRVPFKDRDVDFLPATKALHDAGFNVLMFDLSNHGQSGSRQPLTHGPWEARDFVGAVRYARSRADVDADRIGAIGMSAGGNTVLYGTPHCQPIKAVLAVQPTRVAAFNDRFALDEIGRLGPLMASSMNIVYAFMRAPLASRHDPAVPAKRLGDTVVQYVQGAGDPWGRLGIVEEISAATPGSLGVITYLAPAGRYEGYRYVSQETGAVVAFFTAHL